MSRDEYIADRLRHHDHAVRRDPSALLPWEYLQASERRHHIARIHVVDEAAAAWDDHHGPPPLSAVA